GAAAGIEEEQAKNFQWGLRRSTINHLMCMSYTDMTQVAMLLATMRSSMRGMMMTLSDQTSGRRVVIGINRPLSRVVTGTTVIITTVIDQTGEVVGTITAVATTTTHCMITGISVMGVTRETGVNSPTDLSILVSNSPGVPLRATPTRFALRVDADTQESVVELLADKKPGASGRVFALTKDHATKISGTITEHHATIDCRSYRVIFGDIHAPEFIYHGSLRGKSMQIIFALQARTLLSHGCEGFLATIHDTTSDVPSIHDQPIVSEFPDVFPDELPGIPPVREVEFSIKLIPRAEPISKALYHMAPIELKELKDHCTTYGRRHPGECRRATSTCFKCGQAGNLQKDCKKNTTASTSGQADKKPGASGRVFTITEGHAANTSGMDCA
nr:putative reverse transcriptase domain, aspartic peptidase domain protein [Tanacetum cinerariifolium]